MTTAHLALKRAADDRDRGADRGPARSRWAAVDVLRGAAILAVVAFHLTWDLGDLGLIGWQIGAHRPGKVIAHAIAGSFLFLVGVSLVLGHGSRLRWRSFWRREAQLVLLALVISAATWICQPRAVITFGILHDIAVVSLVCVLFVRLPRWAPWVAAAVSVALPQLVHLPGRSPWVSWTGLAGGTLPTLDWQPLFPWIALAFLGIGVMRWVLDVGEEVATVASEVGVCGVSGEEVATVASGVGVCGVSGEEVPTVARLRAWQPASAPVRWLGRAGRHTLAIYLIHQPILFGALWVLAESRR